MTLNANFAGARVNSRRLQGSDRGLDALVGLVILVAELSIGFLAIYALYQFGIAHNSTAAQVGGDIALWGSVVVVGLTTLIYLVRVIRGTRSWPAPLWGIILMTIILVIGFAIMAAGA